MKRFALHDLGTLGADEPNAFIEGASAESVAAEVIDGNRAAWLEMFGREPEIGVDFELREVQ